MSDHPDPIRVERCPKRVRAVFAGQAVVDTTDARLVWEGRPYPTTYYVPAADARMDLLVDGGEDLDSPTGLARAFDVVVGGRRSAGAARHYADATMPDLVGTVRLHWPAMDAWFEEDEEVYVHPRDPYTRVDVLQSSRHVRVEVDGVTVADSRHPRMLFETGLPPRAYLPKTDVRMDLLTATATTSQCPYKGTAGYYAVRTGHAVHDDLAWWYQHPARESALVAGCICFFDEHVDTYLDGVLQARPRTPFA